MSKSVVITTPTTDGLNPSSITADWILEGKPETRSKELARSHDRTSHSMVWDCTAGRFDWHYNKDETLVILSGEAFIRSEKDGEERRIGTGDFVFFPAGASATWRVPKYIKKVAFLRHTMPRPFGYCVLAWNLFLRIVGLRTSSGL
jgi:uncharacterized protein